MIGTNFLLDTNAIIYLLKGEKELNSILHSKSTVYISVIGVIEYLSFNNLTQEEINTFEDFCENVIILDLSSNKKDIQNIIMLRKKYSLKTPDAIAVNAAMGVSAELITGDGDLFKISEVSILKI
jgi:predicted nucleic acid-binding protein